MHRSSNEPGISDPAPVLAAGILFALIAGGLALSSIPEAELNVSSSAGYQGQAVVAVDPSDPLALLVAGTDDGGPGPTAWSSADGGGIFLSSALPLTYDGHAFAAGSEPAVAVDRDGIWYATYEVHDFDGGSNPIDSSVVVARSFDGVVWEAAAIVEDNRGAGASPAVETPHLAVDLSPTGCSSYPGLIHLVWIRSTGTDRAVYRSYSSNDGLSWTNAAKINDGSSGAEDLWRPRVAVGPDGIVYAAWLDDVQGAVVVDSSANGGYTWTTDVPAAVVNLGCDTGDCGRDLGCSGGALHGSTPALAVDTSWTSTRGTVYVAFADEIVPADGLDVLVTSSIDHGATWSAPVPVPSASTRQQYGPALAVHPVDGSVQAVWYDRRADDLGPDCATEVWHAVSEDGGATWTDETAVTSAPSDYTGDARGEGAHPAVAAGSSKVYPVWTDRRGSDHEVYLGRIARSGGTLVPGGHIDTDTTWSAPASPYVVTGDVTVDPSTTLTIDAGVEVRFATCDALRSGTDANRVELIVEGILDVAGTAPEPVSFNSGDPSPQKRDWYGLRFQNTADSSDSALRHATIEHTSHAIRLSSSSPTLEDVEIDQSFSYGLEGQARAAVAFSPTRVTVNDAGTPVKLSNVHGTWTDVALRNSTGPAGTLSGGAVDLRLVGLSVTGNEQGGLTANLSGGGLEVILSEFNGNGAVTADPGLTVDGNGPRSLVADDFESNLGTGLVLDNDSSGWPSVAVHACNFSGNGGHAVRMDAGSLPADARRNWWGALEAEMTAYPKDVSGIWDIHDDATLRHVDFREHQASAILNDTDLESYLVFPETGMNDNEMVIRGGAVARAGVKRVEVSTDGGSTWADATVEGAAFSFAWSPSPGTYTVLSRVTDLLDNVEPVPDQKTVEIGSGPTLSGTMLTDETWTGPAPIVLQGDVVVPVGTTLTIDPGTTVHAAFLTDDSYGGLDPSRIEIIVEGVLESNGASGNEAVWDSSRAGSGAQKGDWYGIRYRDTTTDELSIVQHSEIGHAVNGVKLEDAAPDVLDSLISNCSQDGLTGDSGTISKVLWRLNRNVIQDNDEDGIDVTGSTEVEARTATVTGNGAQGVRIGASPYPVTVTDANVSNNGTNGMWIDSGSTGFRLLDSTISNNGDDGVHVGGGGDDVRLERLTVSGNGEDGIEVAGGTTMVLLDSTVTGNLRGLRIGSPRLVGAYNTITGNLGDSSGIYPGTAIQYYSGSGAPAVLGMSDIENADTYEVYFDTTRALNARRNWWGTATTASMDAAGYPADLAQFRDIHDDRDKGSLDYDNWAPSSVAGRAPGDLAAHVTWPASGAALDAYSVIVTGVAYAANGIDRVEVCARQAGDPACGDGAGETPYGVVTGKEGWTFEWFPSASGTWELQARVVDTTEAKSIPDEAITIDVALLGPTVTGPIELSGPIIENQTWAGDIELTGDVLVEAGVTLTVQAGATVKARALADDRLGGEDTSRVELMVEGNLVTQGTLGTPVTFSSIRPVPERRDWYGIRFYPSSDPSSNDLDATSVEAGWHGIEFRESFAAMDDVSCGNNHARGLNLSATSATQPIGGTITGGSFSDNGQYGIFLRGIRGPWLLDGVEIARNDSYGVYHYSCTTGDTLTYDGVTLQDNVGYGAFLYNCTRPVELLRSTIDGNDGYGFYADSPQQLTVRGSTFTGQLNTALRANYPVETVLSKNSFSGNVTNAWFSDSSGGTTVVFNDFGPWTNDTEPSVNFFGGSAAITRNAQFNNFRELAPSTPDVAIRNAVAASVNARVNYWDPDTTAEMDANPFPSDILAIEDVEDNIAWGRVDWREHRAAAVDLAPSQVCGFTNPVNGDTLTGTTFTLRGAAAADAGIQMVDISTDGGTTWNPATGEELWTYEWTQETSGFYTLQCRVTDEDSGVQAAPASIDVEVVASDNTHSGPLPSDETWSGVHEITGDITVPAGITLTIEENTTIKASPASDDQFGGVDTSRIELIVEGTLNLQGSAAFPVTFTSGRAIPEAGDWYGIRLLDSSDSTVPIHDLVVEAAVRGIWGYPGSHQDVIDCVVRDMTQDGIYLQFGSGVRDVADPGLIVSGNRVERTGPTHYGIYLYRSGSDSSWNNANHTVSGNVLESTGNYGIYVRPSYANITVVDGNDVTDASYGIYVRASGSTSSANRVEITSNQVADTGSNAIYLYVARDGDVSGNTVQNGTRGINVYQAGSLRVDGNFLDGGTTEAIILSGGGGTDALVHRNTITNYGSHGIQSSQLSSLTALYNHIANVGGNGFDLALNSATAIPRIHWNNLQSSAGYDANLNSSYGADMKRNYWAGTNAEMTAEGYPSEISEIRDIADNDTLGRVDYRAHENVAVDTNVSLESRFVWPFDGDTTSRRTITLEGTAYAAAGVQLVEVSTDNGATWNPASGADFWTYEFTPAADGPQTFLCRVTDNDSTVESTPDQITVTFDSTLPTTEGTLPADEIWSGPSPIVLTGDVIVPEGTTLTLEAGTTLRVQPLADNARGGVDTSRIELIVEGVLDLGGTGGSPVTWTSDRTPDPLAGDWYGIRLTDTAESAATVHDLVVEAGVRGIWSQAGSHPDVVDCVVRDMTQDGIYLQFGDGVRDGGDPGLLVSGNTVQRTGSSYYGIYVYRSGSQASWNDAVHEISGNTTSDTGNYGLFVDPGSAERTEVTGNDVTDAYRGIYVHGSNSTSYGNRLEVHGNQVTDTSSEALYAYLGRSVLLEDNTVTGGVRGIRTYTLRECRIENNVLDGGSGDGLSLTSSGGSVSDTFVHRNTVTGYGGHGISTSGLSSQVITYNTVTNAGGNAFDVYALTSSSMPRIHWNNIQGSTGYDASVSQALGVDMRRNYWAGTNGEMVAEGYPSEISEIFDIEDDTSRGRIDYRGVEDPAIDTNVTRESRFVWPFDGDLIGRRTITIEGTAYAAAGVQLVEVSTDGGSTWSPASGAEFWTYGFTPGSDGPQTLQCRVTDGDGIVEATPDQITVTFDGSLPTTEGTLPGNETWSGSVLLTGDVIVPPGTSLTIDPGTTVEVQPLADNAKGGVDRSRIELIVQGDLIAQGTGPDSILMTSDSTTPARGHWYGIRYAGVPRTLTELRDLSLEWGVRGLSDSDLVGVPDLDGLRIEQMQEDGIYATNAPAGTGDWTITDLNVSQVDRYGAYLSTGSNSADMTLDGLAITDVGSNALQARLNNTESLRLRRSTFDTAGSADTVYVYGPRSATIETVEIHHSNGYGSALYHYSGYNGDVLLVEDSELTGGDRVIDLYRVNDMTLRRNRITDGADGVFVQGYSAYNVVHAFLENNRISDMTSDGVYVGVYADAELHYNDLYNITGYTLENQSPYDLDASDNYWGEDTETEMNAKGCNANIDTIYDSYDNASKGTVTYCEYATDPFGDQPTIYFHDNAGQDEIHWNPKADLTYDLVRGDLANLAVVADTVDLGTVTCEEQANGSGVIPDTSPDPLAGQAWFFLLRDHVTPGNYGQDSSGRERVPAGGDCP